MQIGKLIFNAPGMIGLNIKLKLQRDINWWIIMQSGCKMK